MEYLVLAGPVALPPPPSGQLVGQQEVHCLADGEGGLVAGAGGEQPRDPKPRAVGEAHAPAAVPVEGGEGKGAEED